jgi:hypothetical protein
MNLKIVWDVFFPDVPNDDFGWFERFPEDLLIRALGITKEKDQRNRFVLRTASHIGRYVSGVAKKLVKHAVTVNLDILVDYKVTPKDVQRFESKLQPDGDCLLFASGDKGIYGRFKAGGMSWGAHVFAYFNCHFGQLPCSNELRSLNIAHSCNQPRCCNPPHLRLTTRGVNLWERDVQALSVPDTLHSSSVEEGDRPPEERVDDYPVSTSGSNSIGTEYMITL